MPAKKATTKTAKKKTTKKVAKKTTAKKTNGKSATAAKVSSAKTVAAKKSNGKVVFKKPSTKNRAKATTTTEVPLGLEHEHMVAETAYYLAERRGFQPGGELEDWYQAEQIVATIVHKNA